MRRAAVPRQTGTHRRFAAAAAVAALGLIPGLGLGPQPVRAEAGLAIRPPSHIMSMNLCTDLLLLQLVPKSRIASVTFLAHDDVAAIRPGLDDGVPVNHGAAEDIAMEKPDLIFAGAYSTPVAKALARRVGARVIDVKTVSTFQDVRDVTRQMAALVGDPGRGEAMIADMDRKLAWLAAHPPKRRYSVAAWSGGAAPGKATLANAIIEAAGAINVAARLDSNRSNSFGIEEMLRADPDVLIYADGATKELALHALSLQHPLVRARWGKRTITYPPILFTCGLPQTADAVVGLRRALDRLGARDDS